MPFARFLPWRLLSFPLCRFIFIASGGVTSFFCLSSCFRRRLRRFDWLSFAPPDSWAAGMRQGNLVHASTPTLTPPAFVSPRFSPARMDPIDQQKHRGEQRSMQHDRRTSATRPWDPASPVASAESLGHGHLRRPVDGLRYHFHGVISPSASSAITCARSSQRVALSAAT